MSHPGMRISSLTKAHRHQRARWACVCGHGRSTNERQTRCSSVMGRTRLDDLFLATGFNKSARAYEWSWNGADHQLIKQSSLRLAGTMSLPSQNCLLVGLCTVYQIFTDSRLNIMIQQPMAFFILFYQITHHTIAGQLREDTDAGVPHLSEWFLSGLRI